jgi:hypothetical protein
MKLHYTLRCWSQLPRTNIFHCLDYLSESYGSMFGENQMATENLVSIACRAPRGHHRIPTSTAGSSELGFRLFVSSYFLVMCFLATMDVLWHTLLVSFHRPRLRDPDEVSPCVCPP